MLLQVNMRPHNSSTMVTKVNYACEHTRLQHESLPTKVTGYKVTHRETSLCWRVWLCCRDSRRLWHRSGGWWGTESLRCASRRWEEVQGCLLLLWTDRRLLWASMLGHPTVPSSCARRLLGATWVCVCEDVSTGEFVCVRERERVINWCMN